MATINAVLDTRRKKLGNTYPVKIRIIQHTKSSYITVGFDIQKEYWNSKTQRIRSNHPQSKKLNNKISKALSRASDIILDMERNDNQFSPKFIKAIYEGKVKHYTFLGYGYEYIDRLNKSHKYGTGLTYKSALDKLSIYLDGSDIKFDELDFRFLNHFHESMVKSNLSVNSISVYLRAIRAIFNKAIDEELVDRNYYPFHKFKIKSEKTQSRSLSVEELKLLFSYPLESSTAMWKYRQLFIFSFAFRGMSFIDMAFLTHDNIVDGRLKYRRRKTGKLYSIAINDVSHGILESLINMDTSGEYLLPILRSDLYDQKSALLYARESYRRCNRNLKSISELAEIKKSISTYWSRYSWANAARSLGYSKDMIAEGLGHSYGNRVTGIYLDDYPDEIIDEMNLEILKRVME